MIVASVSGRAAFDPREIQTRSGKPMTTIRLACDGGEGTTIWMDVVAFGWNAQWLARAAKGDRIAAMGEVSLRCWTDQRTNEEKQAMQMVADSLIVPAARPKKAA